MPSNRVRHSFSFLCVCQFTPLQVLSARIRDDDDNIDDDDDEDDDAAAAAADDDD